MVGILAGAGRDSIVYYVTHWPVVTLGVHGLSRLGLRDGFIATQILVGLGLMASRVMVLLRHRFSLASALYSLPARGRRQTA